MNPIEATESFVPLWIEWALTLGVCALVASLTQLSAHLGSRIVLKPLRALGEDAHWHERARLAYPPRIYSGAIAVLPAAIAVSLAGHVADVLYDVPRFAVFSLVLAAALIPGFRARLVMERDVRRTELSTLRWMRGGVVLVLLTMPHLLIALAVGLLMPSRFDARAYVTLAAGCAFTFYLLRGGVLDVAKLLRVARPASPRLAAIVERAAEQTGVRPRDVVELHLPWANAYAYPLSAKLAFTDEAITSLADDEIAAVCAHEIGHLAEPKSVAATRLVGAFVFFIPFALAKPLVASFGPKSILFVFLAAYAGAIALRLILVRLFKRLETRADAMAHKHEGDAGTYARALTRIHEVNLMPVVMPKGRGVHPNLYDRVAAAGAPMSTPRPDPPPRARAFVALFAALVLLIAGFVGAVHALDAAVDYAFERTFVEI